MVEFWNERYASDNYVYGKHPNLFFRRQLVKLSPGKILLPAEGEGRNAVFAAKYNWKVHAIDASKMGREKAILLANENKVDIIYEITNLQDYKPIENEYDALALIYVHLPSQIRKAIHAKLAKSLKSGGTLIIETFSKKQINNNSGGPKDPEMLYNLDDLLVDFQEFEFTLAEEIEIELNEGEFHQGKADVVRIVGKKTLI